MPDGIVPDVELPDRARRAAAGPAGLARRAARAAHRRVAGLPPPGLVARIGVGPASREAVGRIPRDIVVVANFGELPDRAYQLEQWFPVLEQLDVRHRVLILLREARTIRMLESRTSLPLVCAPTVADLLSFYERCDPKVAFYVNNAMRNFQALNNARMLHVHVGHGESDKPSSYSNQSKAYDRVFVAGPAAVARYQRALMGFDESRFVTVGRPQLDLANDPHGDLPPTERRTVTYAPTWEGTRRANNWTSLTSLGASLVDQALATPDVRVVYRPHPRVLHTADPYVARRHQEIVSLVETAAAADPEAGHTVSLTGHAQPLLRASDALVGDVSSVSLDYLYLRPDGPVFLTDPAGDPRALRARTRLASAADVLDAASVGEFATLLAKRLADDLHVDDRARVRAHYFDDLGPGESTARFLDAVDSLVAERDAAVAGRAARAADES